jgi:hypothetical protein
VQKKKNPLAGRDLIRQMGFLILGSDLVQIIVPLPERTNCAVQQQRQQVVEF